MMKTKQKGAARSDGSNKKSNKQQPKSSRHRSTEAHQRKQQPTNRVDDSNSDRGRGRQTESTFIKRIKMWRIKILLQFQQI